MSTDFDSKVETLTVILGFIAIFTELTFAYSADEFSGIDADNGLKRLENRFYWVLTTRYRPWYTATFTRYPHAHE